MRSLQVFRPCCTLHGCITAIYHSEFGETISDLKRKNIYYTMTNEETMRNMLNMGGKWIPYEYDEWNIERITKYSLKSLAYEKSLV